MTEEQCLFPGVDVPPAPSLPLPTEVRHNNKSLHWRNVFKAQVADVIGQFVSANGKRPRVKDVVAYFPADDTEHHWPDGTLIKNRRRIWV